MTFARDQNLATRFSTDELVERTWRSVWREEFARSMLRVEIEQVSDLPFHADARVLVHPGCRILTCKGSAIRSMRPKASTADCDHSFAFVVSRACTASQCGHEVSRESGDAVALFSREPGKVRRPDGFYVVVLVPRNALASRVKNVDDLGAKLIHADNQSLQLLMKYLECLPEKFEDPRLSDLAATHVYDLMVLALGPDRAATEGGMHAPAAQLNEILDYIAAHYQAPGLSVAAVARRQGISPRYVQKLMESTGQSFTERVNELRLQRAFTLLAAAHQPARRISDIALEAGFSDTSYFNRLFRARFAETPSAVRADGCGAVMGSRTTAIP